IDNVSAGTAALNMDGDGALYAQTEYIGFNGSGKLAQTSGTNGTVWGPTVPTAAIFLGTNPGSSGGYEISGGSVNVMQVNVGGGGAGLFVETGGEVDAMWMNIGS